MHNSCTFFLRYGRPRLWTSVYLTSIVLYTLYVNHALSLQAEKWIYHAGSAVDSFVCLRLCKDTINVIGKYLYNYVKSKLLPYPDLCRSTNSHTTLQVQHICSSLPACQMCSVPSGTLHSKGHPTHNYVRKIYSSYHVHMNQPKKEGIANKMDLCNSTCSAYKAKDECHPYNQCHTCNLVCD